MSIPDFQTIMRPLLAVLADGEERQVQAIRETLAQEFELTEEELEERLPSGRQRTYVNRVAWALAHLKGAALIESPRRGVYRATARGQQVLAETPKTERVDLRVLRAFDEYRQFRAPTDNTTPAADVSVVDAAAGTPTERMQGAHRELRAAVVVDVLERVQEQTWTTTLAYQSRPASRSSVWTSTTSASRRTAPRRAAYRSSRLAQTGGLCAVTRELQGLPGLSIC